ncbi:putative uncharacterized protein DDB_G0290521 [Bactrocera tryoni]|uniref:putative uncharacterized protein DDB_G0290521 n=1 Tax=Bactrocera tryoni TaxID=59916 RepID=UPI001A965F7B|nr:putative uncharacterized protein DDB_G0290521 [Bactrocera tryoni]
MIYTFHLCGISRSSTFCETWKYLSGVTSISSDEEEEASVPVQSLKKFKKGATERTEFLKNATEHLETSKKQMDEAEIYANAWACMYRQMKPEQQRFAKQAVDEVMLLGRFGKLCFNYLHSPSSSPNLSSPHVSRTSSPFLSNDSPLYISTSSVSPTESTSRFSHFTSLPTGSPIQATTHSQRLTSVPIQATSLSQRFTPAPAISPIQAPSHSQRFTSVTIQAPSHSPRFISVPTGSPVESTSQTIEITPELHFADENESQYTSVFDLLNDSQYQ